MNLNQIIISSLDFEKSIMFYKNLDLKLIVKSFSNCARFKCLEGNSAFSIQQVEQLPTGNGIHIYFECNNLNKYVN